MMSRLFDEATTAPGRACGAKPQNWNVGTARYCGAMATKTSRAAKAPGYKCAECGWTTVKWVGRCGECQAWGTVEETGAAVARTTAATTVLEPARPIAEVDATTAAFLPTGVDELDRVLGGGVVPGAVILLAGEPGVGKSTLLLDVAAKFARTGQSVLYVTGEESAAQVKLRAERIDAIADTLCLSAETDLGQALGQVEKVEPKLLVVDSVHTLSSADVEGSSGGVSQVREVAASIIAAAKRRNMTTLLVGHVTKDGSIAGPRLLEHLVDVVCQFEGERHHGSGCFARSRTGTGPRTTSAARPQRGRHRRSRRSERAVRHAHQGSRVRHLHHRHDGGQTAVAGRSPVAAGGKPQFAAAAGDGGLDSSRVAMLLAVLQQRAGCLLHKDDSYVATVGGVKLSEPATDLAVALAVASAKAKKAAAAAADRFWRGGAGGEVRPVPGINQRIQEAHRLGFTHAVVRPATTARAPFHRASRCGRSATWPRR